MGFQIKQINYQGSKSIVLQNENGPCPLIALVNCLVLRGNLELKGGETTVQDLVTLLADYLLNHPPNGSEEYLANYHKQLDDVLLLLPSLEHGMDVNVYFDRPDHFESTPQLSVFDIFRIDLYHGWVCDPNDTETFMVLNKLQNYNKIVEQATMTDIMSQSPTSGMNMVYGVICKQFLQDTASQLTQTGLEMLSTTMNTLPQVFFRNNHFSTILKTEDGRLWTLVTDLGYLSEAAAVWESVDLLGNSEIVSGEFMPFLDAVHHYEQEKQVIEDEDRALALQLQENEERLAQECQLREQEHQLREQQRKEAMKERQSTETSFPGEKKCLIQ
ncbi:hypothetical protein EDD86DRAFT_201696 [Gorgonomyces haynaldii]|nr:hypothetical protein EDD86DRAFT_201696 [Gorgonomyces haynaldii]